MRTRDKQCIQLAEIQADLFEKSTKLLDMSSDVFFRRFMNSNIAKDFDSGAILEVGVSVNGMFSELDNQYGHSNYGSYKYHPDIMYWCGYLYRHLCYLYEISSKQAYKLFPLNYVASTFEAYHTQSIEKAIEMLLEAKGISFDEIETIKRGVSILRKMRAQGSLKLVKLSCQYIDQFNEMMDEWCLFNKTHKDNDVPYAIFKNDYHDFDNYLKHLEIEEEKDGLVSDSTFFALDIKRNIFVGAINIRHHLNEKLLERGGHIGDGIRPSERRKGYATEMIRLGLEECKKLNIYKVLMVCDKDNIGSRKSIISNGGILEDERNEPDGNIIQRYWIELSN